MYQPASHSFIPFTGKPCSGLPLYCVSSFQWLALFQETSVSTPQTNLDFCFSRFLSPVHGVVHNGWFFNIAVPLASLLCSCKKEYKQTENMQYIACHSGVKHWYEHQSEIFLYRKYYLFTQWMEMCPQEAVHPWHVEVWRRAWLSRRHRWRRLPQLHHQVPAAWPRLWQFHSLCPAWHLLWWLQALQRWQWWGWPLWLVSVWLHCFVFQMLWMVLLLRVVFGSDGFGPWEVLKGIMSWGFIVQPFLNFQGAITW